MRQNKKMSLHYKVTYGCLFEKYISWYNSFSSVKKN